MRAVKKLLCIAVFLMGLFAAAMAEDPVVVRVNKVEYPLSLAQYSLKSELEMSAFSAEAGKTADRETSIEAVIENLVRMGTIENKLMEKGRHTLTQEEENTLRTYANDLYRSIWEDFKKQVTDAGYETDDETIMKWLQDELGYSLDIVYQEALAQTWMDRVLELYCSDVAITVSEVVQYLEENYINPDREAYENDIPRYEEEILQVGNEAFFIPEGYKVIRQILLPFPEETTREVSALLPKWQQQDAEVSDLKERIVEAVLEGNEVEGLRGECLARMEEKKQTETEIEGIRAQAPTLLSQTIEEIYSRLDSGEPFTQLMQEYSTLPNKVDEYFHEKSKIWAPAFHDAAAALKNVGDVSRPVVTEVGVHIIQYADDLPGGVQKLNAEEEEALRQAAYRSKQLRQLNELVVQWEKEYSIETHPELLR